MRRLLRRSLIDPARPPNPGLQVAARFGLGGRPPSTRVEVTRASVIAATHDRLCGLVVDASAAGWVVADAATEADLRDRWRTDMLGSVLVESLAVRVADTLDDAAARWRLTKGPALVHLDYADQPSVRGFGDLDVVVHPDDWRTALDALAVAGIRRPGADAGPTRDPGHGKGVTLQTTDGLEVDLHRRFCVGRFGVTARTEDLFGRSDRIVLAGRALPTLAGPDRLLHACHHLVLGGFSGLRAARDVAQLVLVSAVDWRDARETARRWHAEAVLAAGLRWAWSRLDLVTDHPAHRWAVGFSPGRVDARCIDLFATGRSYRVQALTAFLALPPRRIPGYARALAASTGRSGR